MKLVDDFMEKRKEQEFRKKLLLREYEVFFQKEKELEGHEILDAFKPTDITEKILVDLVEYAIFTREAVFKWEVKEKTKKYLDDIAQDLEEEYYLELRQCKIFLKSYTTKKRIESLLELDLSRDSNKKIKRVIGELEKEIDERLSSLSDGDFVKLQLVKGY